MLIEVLTASAVFAILSGAIISLVVLLYQTVADVRIKTIARHLAVQQMEFLNNIPYASLGTTTGIPSGSITEFETVNRNGFIFTIHTSITYVDDPFDQQSPQDLLPTDYKQVRVEILWNEQLGLYREPIVLASVISPKGVETTTGGGTLSVFVINSAGVPLSSTSVRITNTTLNPPVDVTLQTDVNGYLILPGARPCAACYNVTVTKNGYSTDKTYTTIEVANPNKRPLTVSAGSLTESTFIIDRLASLTIESYSGAGQFTSSPNSQFRLTGSKTVGLDSQDNPVYKFDQTLSTGSNSRYTNTTLEWDTYILTVPDNTKHISAIYPHQPFSVTPGDTITLAYSTTPATAHSLLFSFEDATGSAIASASAMLKLSNQPVATISSGIAKMPNFGQSFFENLTGTTYSFTITHPEYADFIGTLPVYGYTTDKVVMIHK